MKNWQKATGGVLGGVALVVGTMAVVNGAAVTETAACTISPTAPVISTLADGREQVKTSTKCVLPARPTKTKTITQTVTASPSPTDTATPTPTDTSSSTPTPSPTDTSTPAPSPTDTTSPPPTSGFPDASNTGVPSGTVLKRVPQDITTDPNGKWNYSNGVLSVTADGAVLDGLDVDGWIAVHASNVTISRTRAWNDGDWWVIGVYDAAQNVTIEDSTLSGRGSLVAVGIKDVGGNSDINVYRNDISDWTTGIQMSRGEVIGNFVHDPQYIYGGHNNGFTDNGGRTDGSVLLKDNTFLNPLDQTDAISFFQDFGTIQNVTVDHNLMAGGSYCLYAGGGYKGTSSNVSIINNQFSTRYFPECGVFGPTAGWDGGPGNVWSGNTWADGPKAGQVLNHP